MAIGLGEGAELRAPLAVTVIGGLTVATILTLFVIPVVYTVLDRKAFVVLAGPATAPGGATGTAPSSEEGPAPSRFGPGFLPQPALGSAGPARFAADEIEPEATGPAIPARPEL
jgi:hypothetical protein